MGIKLYRAAFAVGAVLATPTFAHAGDNWYLLGVAKDYSQAVYVDVTSIKTAGATRTATMQLVERVSAQPDDLFATSVLVQTDCAAHAQKLLKLTNYNELGPMADRAVTGAEESAALASGRGDLEAKFVCSPPESWDKTQFVDEGSVGGSIRDYARFMLGSLLLDALNRNGGSAK